MGKWRAAPLGLKLGALIGAGWFIALVVIGVPFLLKEGPGLPLIWLGSLGLAPAIWIVLRDDRAA